MHLDERLPAGSLEAAAAAGLQDSAPRAGLLSLHARLHGVGPHTWEDERLVQVWGPRQAVWLVPRSGVAAFTLGRLPRDPDQVAHLEHVADEALRSRGRDRRQLRAAAATGRYLVRWDAHTTRVVEVEPPAVDPEDARRDLARRFLAWFGEAMRPAFARWAGVGDEDAEETLRHLPPSEAPPATGPPHGVRLLPLFDPYGWGRGWPTMHDRQLVGAVLVDGRKAGTWARQGRQVTVQLRSPRHLDVVEQEALALARPLGGPVKLHLTGAG